MADDEKKGYPQMSQICWWALRKKFRTTMPGTVTPTYLASALNMTPASARNNILPSLRLTGLVDAEGKPTDRAVKWRDDTQYPDVCRSIREDIYPQELLDLAPDNTADRTSVQKWFANHMRTGESAAAKTTAFYLMLCEADVSKETVSKATPSPRSKVKSTPKAKSLANPQSFLVGPSQEENAKPDGEVEDLPTDVRNNRDHIPPRSSQPSIHVNVQIHISPESSAEQIEVIFSSMAKNLKDFS